jgi:F-type H+-transporting ATPase subunit delta
MRDIKVASRYAKSLLGIALEQNSLEELHNDMQFVNGICNDNHDLVLLLKSPIVRGDKKKAILDAIFGGEVSKVAATFINIILIKKRESLLADIASAFIDTYKNHKNIKTAQVTTAVVLTKEQKEKVVELLKSSENASIELNEVVDKEIIGGMILKVGDRQIDESIRRKLTNLEMEFDQNLYVKEF